MSPNSRRLNIDPEVATQALALSSDAVFTVTDELVVQAGNATCARLFGYRPLELQGRPLKELLPDLDELQPESALECRALNRRGKQLPVRVNLLPVSSPQSSVSAVLVVRDMTRETELRRSLQQANKNRAILGRLLELSLQDMDLDPLLDAACEVLAASHWFEASLQAGIFLLGDDGDLELRASQQLPSELAAQCKSVRQGQCLCGAAAESHALLFAGPGDPRRSLPLADQHAHFHVPLLRGSQLLGLLVLYLPPDVEPDAGFIDFINAVARVLSEVILNKRSQLELLAASERAQEATRTKSAFLATMSHEIRTPMNGIIGMSDLLRDTPLSIDQQDMVDTINHSGESLLAIINDILDFSKIEAGKMDLDPVATRLDRMMKDAVEVLRPKFEEQGIQFRVETAAAVPEAVLVDPTRLRQVLLNLAGNAVKFTKEGGVVIRVDYDGKGEKLRVCVEDTGVGIPAAALPRLFQEFSQADASTTRKFGGTGLGLTITKRLVELMGGRISARSIEGRGSTFEFTVSAPPTAATSERGEQRVQERFMGEVLLVEDNVVNQKVAQKLLNKLGLQAKVAINGKEGVEAARSGRFAVILMDCQMPIMDGYTATEEIRRLEEADAHLPIIAMTASAQESDKQRCLGSGMDDFISKPVTLKALRSTLQRWLPPDSVRS